MTMNCSGQTSGFGVLCGSHALWVLFGVVSGVLVFSLCWNILCCVQKHWAARGKAFLPRFRRSISLKRSEMEDNPIYGNITYTHSRDHSEERPARAFSAGRECYANLTLKVPKVPSGRSSPAPQIQYSDVMTVNQDPVEPEPDGEEDPIEKDTCSMISELYASVDAEHIKTKKQDNNEPYANHV
ncbi:signaling threshold-regulating transmembrane adapter 1 isoform X2 [Astyanax mexicanus]|uniref:Signaling threshold-regulating transmembrane adapter 1-like isoform X2 n=1 Tax=Astyanax mexicanus TaxID=7994 RepID=A0A8T2KL32_ASTMX|nr:signaling threshold-regulating transmembrane adapter 1 isoform X2 [Astyanax mexicanus]KAG9260430.1 signaling threshold-regulating transmembrane adapter 1-like isoform X2 [Astyanax mexicanus]